MAFTWNVPKAEDHRESPRTPELTRQGAWMGIYPQTPSPCPSSVLTPLALDFTCFLLLLLPATPLVPAALHLSLLKGVWVQGHSIPTRKTETGKETERFSDPRLESKFTERGEENSDALLAAKSGLDQRGRWDAQLLCRSPSHWSFNYLSLLIS